MVRDFQPFFDLWTTASNWGTWREKWLNDPLVSIDPEVLDRNVSEAHKTMHKCFKQFKELPGWSHVLLYFEKKKCPHAVVNPLHFLLYFFTLISRRSQTVRRWPPSSAAGSRISSPASLSSRA